MKRFLAGSDEERRQQFKIIIGVSNRSPLLMRTTIPNKPVIPGKVIQCGRPLPYPSLPPCAETRPSLNLGAWSLLFDSPFPLPFFGNSPAAHRMPVHVNREGNYVEVDLFTQGSTFAVRVRARSCVAW